VRVWDLRTGDSVDMWETGQKAIAHVFFDLEAETCFALSEWATSILSWRRDATDLFPQGPRDRGPIRKFVVNDQGTRALSLGSDKDLGLWDLTTGEWIHGFDIPPMFGRDVAIDAAGTVGACAMKASVTLIYDLVRCEFRRLLRPARRNGSVNVVALSPDGTVLVTCNTNGTAEVWDTQTGICRNTVGFHTESVECITLDPRQDLVITGSNDASLRVWSFTSAQLSHTLWGHNAPVSSVSFSDGIIVSVDRSGLTLCWDVDTGKRLSDEESAQFVASLPTASLVDHDTAIQVGDGATFAFGRPVVGHQLLSDKKRLVAACGPNLFVFQVHD